MSESQNGVEKVIHRGAGETLPTLPKQFASLLSVKPVGRTGAGTRRDNFCSRRGTDCVIRGWRARHVESVLC